MAKKKRRTTIKLTIEEIFKMLCPTCKEKLLTLVANSIATSSVKEQLKNEWENPKKTR